MYYLSLQNIMFWTKKAKTFRRYRYANDATPTKKGKGYALNDSL